MSKFEDADKFIKRQLSSDTAQLVAGVNGTSGIQCVQTDFDEWLFTRFIHDRIERSLDTDKASIKIDKFSVDKDELFTFIKQLFPTCICTHISRYKSFITDVEFYCDISTSNSQYSIHIFGDSRAINKLKGALENQFEVISISIEWVTSQELDSCTLPVSAPKNIDRFAFPFINGGEVDEFVDDYLNSSENILLLIGPPGTGKSSYLQHIITRSERNALVTYDPEIMMKDGIFGMFMEGDYGTFVMEDADAFLTARTDGNTMMSKFLNVSSGIISTKRKKIIFSTNLDDVESIDPAILRPGRCFSVVQFRKLTFTESKEFINQNNIAAELEVGSEYTLAELYNFDKKSRKNFDKKSRKTVKRKFGFI
jgi:hypothetical protein